MEENYMNAMEEHEEGTVIPLNSTEALNEKYENLQLKHAEALSAGNEAEALKIETELNHIEHELGLSESKTAA